MFVISLNYIADINEVEQYLQEHQEYLEKYYQSGAFIISGRKQPRTGGIIIAAVPSREELDTIITEDPFYTNNIATHSVTEFLPSKAASHIQNYLES